MWICKESAIWITLIFDRKIKGKASGIQAFYQYAFPFFPYAWLSRSIFFPYVTFGLENKGKEGSTTKHK